MSNCLTCGEVIEQKRGKRARLYCNDLCRGRYFQRNGKKNKKAVEVPPQPSKPTIDPNETILKQISAVRAELVPSYRNTVLGRKTWEAEQRQRILELESKLK